MLNRPFMTSKTCAYMRTALTRRHLITTLALTLGSYAVLGFTLIGAIPLRSILKLDPAMLALFPHFIAFVNAVALTALAVGWWFI